jgi:hypothetical protein
LSGSGVDVVAAATGANEVFSLADYYSIATAASDDHVAPRGADEAVGSVRANYGRGQIHACGRGLGDGGRQNERAKRDDDRATG